MTLRRVPALQAAVMVAAASSACVKIEPFRGSDSGVTPDGDAAGPGSDSSPGDTIPKAIATMSGGRVSVEVAGLYKMEFSEQAFHFPDKLTIRGVQVMGPPTASCNTEYGTGVTWAPAGEFGSRPSSGLSSATSDTITIDFDGMEGGIAKVRLDWEAPFTSCAFTPSGRSTFTFFPDGRIQRMDTASITGVAMTNDCDACETASNWDIASYYAFEEADVHNLFGIAVPAAGNGNQTSTGSSAVCFNDENQNVYRIAMGWWTSEARRVRRVDTSLAVIANYAPIAPATGTGHLGDTSTAMWIDPVTADCPALTQRIAPYINGTTLEITAPGGGTEFITMGQDGIYGGENSGTPMPTGRHTGAQPTVIMRAGNGPIGPFAVWLNLIDRPVVTSVSRVPASTRTQWYTQEQLRDDQGYLIPQYLFYFADGLAGDDTITIAVSQ